MSAFYKERLAQLHDVLHQYVESGEIPGIVSLISRRGEVEVETVGSLSLEGQKPMRRDTIFRIASMSKPIMAAAAMILVEDCTLRLDEPVERLLPELANRRVLRRIDGPLDDTVPANRSITLRDLLTFRLGIGLLLPPPGETYPIRKALIDAGLQASGDPLRLAPDEWIRRLGELPLAYQPGERWLYHTGSDVLSILVARAAGKPLEQFMRERLFEPLGMKDTGFSVSAEKLHRLPASYTVDPESGKLVVHDDPKESQWSKPPLFPSGGNGLVSTVDDYLAFYQMLLNKGTYGRVRVLSRPSVELMTMDHLTAEQKAEARFLLNDHLGWGFGVSVVNRRYDLSDTPGRFGWFGGFGTSAFADPKEGLIGVLMTQRALTSPEPPKAFVDFWTTVYQALGD